MKGRSEVLYLGTFPPRQCGIATYTADVVSAVDLCMGSKSDLIAVDDLPNSGYLYPKQVFAQLRQHDHDSYASSATFINAHPAQTLNIQHEYGIFGGPDGAWVLELIDRVRKPIVLTLHTVVPVPSQEHRALTQRLCSAVDRVVVLSEVACDLLAKIYAVPRTRISVIPHGVPDVPFTQTDVAKAELGLRGRFVVTTFGLIGRGKGLETAIDAIARVARRNPEVLYVILGATHPVVRRQEGEAYRNELREQIARLGVGRNVTMVDRYLSLADLLQYLAASDVYVTPYVNEAQVVSGTLAYALACGKPVVSTPYLYARELLADRRGLLVPFDRPTPMASAVEKLAADDRYRLSTAKRAYEYGRRMTWANVGRAYAALHSAVAVTSGYSLANNGVRDYMADLRADR